MQHTRQSEFLRAEFLTVTKGAYPKAFDELWALLGATVAAPTRLKSAILEQRIRPNLSWVSYSKCGCAYGVVYQDDLLAARAWSKHRPSSKRWSDLEIFLLYPKAPDLILRTIELWERS